MLRTTRKSRHLTTRVVVVLVFQNCFFWRANDFLSDGTDVERTHVRSNTGDVSMGHFVSCVPHLLTHLHTSANLNRRHVSHSRPGVQGFGW